VPPESSRIAGFRPTVGRVAKNAGARQDEQVPSEDPSQQELAIERTIMAHERTLMAWLRTSLAMISFGFTLRHFFEYLVQKEGRKPASLFGPRGYGLAMMLLGLLMLTMASIQHAKNMKRFGGIAEHKPFSLALVFALVCLILGALALVATIAELANH
jgi:putative membrane protein